MDCSLKSFTVETSDGVQLQAKIFSPREKEEEEDEEEEDEEQEDDERAKGNDELVVILVHPYSILGGCQGFLGGIASGLARKGYKAVTFDMRGVGRSTGAPIAGSAVDKVEQVVGYVSIGYPFGFMASILFGRHHKAILKSPKPKLFIMGTQDGFTSVKQLKNKLSSAVGRVESHLIEGVSHF